MAALLIILALLGGVFHHHESGSDCAVCLVCQGVLASPAVNLAAVLAAAPLKPVGFLAPVLSRFVARLDQFAPLAPRAPPRSTPLDIFREGGAVGA